MQPITFQPIYKHRVWGGRALERLYHRSLPGTDIRIGESWELVDRPEDQSIVNHGPFAGASLHALWNDHRATIFGEPYHSYPPRFPILIKLLDTQQDLSIQVHPPAHVAEQLGGEPKSEMWWIARCSPGATLYVGLKPGISRKDFEQAIQHGTVDQCVNRITPSAGDALFIPSGQVHAIGGGFLIHEIQQNSNTTYRVFDWNRPDIDGNLRPLHIDASLACMHFHDVEPTLDHAHGKSFIHCDDFRTEHISLLKDERAENTDPNRFSIYSILSGELTSSDGRRFGIGDTVLLPQGHQPLIASSESSMLRITLP